MPRDEFGHELDGRGNPLIEWTPAKLAELRKLYDSAIAAGAETFKFEGLEFLTSYAKYLIEYLEGRLGE